MERAHTLGEKNTTIRFTKENYTFLKHYCVDNDISINAVVNNFIDKLKEKSKKTIDKKKLTDRMASY